VLTGDGLLRLTRVRLGSGDEVDAATVVTSVRATLGLRMADLVARIRALEARLDSEPPASS
jgi:hypothetical protein